MKSQLVRAATVFVALGFLVGASLAAGGGAASHARDGGVEPKDAGAPRPAPTPRPEFLPATKAAMPMHFPDAPSPAQRAAPSPQPSPQQAAPGGRAP